MAAFNKFNATAATPFNGGINLSSDTTKCLLTNTVPVATNTQYSDISGTEVAAGNGYTIGGAAITTVSSTQTTGLYKFVGTAGNPTWTATGSMGTFRYVVWYDTTPTIKTLLGWWDFGSSLSLTAGQTFTLQPDPTNGMLQNS